MEDILEELPHLGNAVAVRDNGMHCNRTLFVASIPTACGRFVAVASLFVWMTLTVTQLVYDERRVEVSTRRTGCRERDVATHMRAGT